MVDITRAYIYRSHTIVTLRLPCLADRPRYTYEVDGQRAGTDYGSSIAAMDAAEAAIDTLVEDGPPPPQAERLPGIWGDA